MDIKMLVKQTVVHSAIYLQQKCQFGDCTNNLMRLFTHWYLNGFQHFSYVPEKSMKMHLTSVR